MGIARKSAKSVTFYLPEEVDNRLTEFAEKTFRSKSNTLELLLCKSLEDLESAELAAMPERRDAPERRAPGELLDRAPAKPGRKRKDPGLQDDIPETAPKRGGRKPKVEESAEAAPAPKKRGRPAKAAAPIPPPVKPGPKRRGRKPAAA